jgi:hypothetical protein
MKQKNILEFTNHLVTEDIEEINHAISCNSLFSLLVGSSIKKFESNILVAFYLSFISRFNGHVFCLYDAEVFNHKEHLALLRLIKSIYNGEVNISYLINGPYHFVGLDGSSPGGIPKWINDIQLLDEWFKIDPVPGLKKLDGLQIIFSLTSILFDLKQYQVKTPKTVSRLLSGEDVKKGSEKSATDKRD